MVNGEVTVISFGREPWSRLGFFRLWVRIPAPYTRWTFIILFVAKIIMFVGKRPKIKEKEAGVQQY